MLSYWDRTGKYQKEYNRLMDELVPETGKADTVHGELLRTFSNAYYDHSNNGGCNNRMSEFVSAAKTAGFKCSSNCILDREWDDLADAVILFVLEKDAAQKERQNKVKTHWNRIETLPENGRFYLFSDGKEMRVLNKPRGHVLGIWHKRRNKWYGASLGAFNPTHWTELPEHP